MTTTYILKSANSDLTGGADFNKELSINTETPGTINIAVAKATTEDSFGYTISGEPGTNGTSGDYTVEINIITANESIELSTAVARVNSLGVQQAISSFTSEQNGGTIGVKTFSFTNPSLGTWNSGDRLRVTYRFRNTASHATSQISIETGTTDTEVIAPWTASVSETVYPSTQTLNSNLGSPQINYDYTQIVSTQTLSLTLYDPTISIDVIVYPTALDLTLNLQTPDIFFDYAIGVSALSLTLSSQDPSVNYDYIVFPSVQTLITTPHDPVITIEVSEIVYPSSLDLATNLLVPDLNFDYTMMPNELSLSLTLQSPTINYKKISRPLPTSIH